MTDKHDPTSAPDTGHVWDDNLRELTNPPPRWWMITFYMSGLFILVYIILYPAIPLIDGSTKGILGWTSMKRLQENVKELEAVRAPFENKIKGMSAAAILADKELANYTVRSAKVLFGDRCAPCHGTGGAGNPGYPVLADDDWLYGGSIETIQESITDGRMGMMPGFAGMVNETELIDLSKHVLALSNGGQHDAGKAVFDAKGCGGCHGADAKGMTMMGSANLTDPIWRFAPGTEQSIQYTIKYGVNSPGATETRETKMPTFKDQLTESEIKKLAVYVHKLGGGE